MSSTVEEKARDEIVFALRNIARKSANAGASEFRVEASDAPRLAVRVEEQDLDAAIDDMIERFPKTLEHLAK